MRRILRGSVLAAAGPLVAAACLSVSAAHAATIENGVVGLKLIMLDKYSLGKAKAVYVAKGDSGIQKGPGGDPPGLTGTVEIIRLTDPNNRAVYSLPDPWLVNKDTVGKFVDKTAGPGVNGAKVVVIKPGLVGKLVAKNLGDGDSASGDQSANDLNLQDIVDTDVIRVVMTVNNANDGNTYIFCSDFSGLSIKVDGSNQPFKVLSKSSTAPGSCAVGPPTTSTTTSTTTTSTTTTTVVTISGCCGPTRDQLSFTTGVGSGNCGTIQNSSGTVLANLSCGSLYVGGGQNAVPPAAIPDLGQSVTNVTSCDSTTGALVLSGATAGQTGSNFNCTVAGCFFGAPLPIPNPASVPTSTCVINTVSGTASGTGNCVTGDSTLSIPLDSQIYLTGDLLDGSASDRPAVAGIQPCPLCTGGTCKGGPNNGLACTPDTTTGGGLDQYPTSHDCPPPDTISTNVGTIPIDFDLTTGVTQETSVNQNDQVRVFCGYCRDGNFNGSGSGNFQNPFVPCTSDADCTNPGFPDCEQRDPGAFGTAVSGGATRTITGTGSPAGNMTDGLSHGAKVVSIFCIPPTFNSTVDNTANLPGPGFAALDGQAQLQ